MNLTYPFPLKAINQEAWKLLYLSLSLLQDIISCDVISARMLGEMVKWTLSDIAQQWEVPIA